MFAEAAPARLRRAEEDLRLAAARVLSPAGQ